MYVTNTLAYYDTAWNRSKISQLNFLKQKLFFTQTKKERPLWLQPLSAKANGREPKSCLRQVFNYKLGCFGDMHILNCVGTCPHLELKTWPRFRPVGYSLSMAHHAVFSCSVY
jgi:hypothetical protein